MSLMPLLDFSGLRSIGRGLRESWDTQAAWPALEKAIYGQGADGGQSMSLSALSAPVEQVARAPLGQPMDRASMRVAQAHGDPMQSLIQNESGGNWAAKNDVVGAGGKKGHFGRLQFGQARLEDAKRAGVLPASMTPDQFMSSPEAQMATERWHFSDIDQKAQEKGLMSYVGQNVGGVTITPDSIRAMAHLGGINGAERYLKTGGRYNPADANGTRLSDYAQRHGGGRGTPSQAQLESMAVGQSMPMGQGQSQTAPQQAMQGAGQPSGGSLLPDRDTMRQLFQNRQTRPFAIQLAQNAMKARQGDPMAQIELEKARLELEQMRNPQVKPTDTMRNLEWRAQQAGLQPGTPEYAKFMQTGGAQGTQINIGQSEYGTIPQGYELFTDPQTGARSMRRIAGGPADEEQTQRLQQQQSAMQAYQQKHDMVDKAITDVLSNVGGWTAGPVGGLLSNVPGTTAYDMGRTIDTIKANLGFEELQRMRDNSPTGGALGQVTERELAFLQAAQGNLDQAQTPEQLKAVLADIQKRRREFSEARRRAYEIDFGQPAPKAGPEPSLDELLDKYGD